MGVESITRDPHLIWKTLIYTLFKAVIFIIAAGLKALVNTQARPLAEGVHDVLDYARRPVWSHFMFFFFFAF